MRADRGWFGGAGGPCIVRERYMGRKALGLLAGETVLQGGQTEWCAAAGRKGPNILPAWVALFRKNGQGGVYLRTRGQGGRRCSRESGFKGAAHA